MVAETDVAQDRASVVKVADNVRGAVGVGVDDYGAILCRRAAPRTQGAG